MLTNLHSARPLPSFPLPQLPPALWHGICRWMRYVQSELGPLPFAHVSLQFGLYSFLQYEDNYGSNFVSPTPAPQTFRVLIAFLAV